MSTHWRSYLDSDVIRYVDLGDKEHVVQITAVKKGKVVGTGGKANGKAMISLLGKDKPVAAGTAILSAIAQMFGNDTKEWVNRWITIWPDPNVSFGGAKVGGIRVRASAPSQDAIDAALAIIKKQPTGAPK